MNQAMNRDTHFSKKSAFCSGMLYKYFELHVDVVYNGKYMKICEIEFIFK